METPEKQVQLSLLLVDDDKELCAMMKEFFAEAGHRLGELVIGHLIERYEGARFPAFRFGRDG